MVPNTIRTPKSIRKLQKIIDIRTPENQLTPLPKTSRYQSTLSEEFCMRTYDAIHMWCGEWNSSLQRQKITVWPIQSVNGFSYHTFCCLLLNTDICISTLAGFRHFHSLSVYRLFVSSKTVIRDICNTENSWNAFRTSLFNCKEAKMSMELINTYKGGYYLSAWNCRSIAHLNKKEV